MGLLEGVMGKGGADVNDNVSAYAPIRLGPTLLRGPQKDPRVLQEYATAF